MRITNQETDVTAMTPQTNPISAYSFEFSFSALHILFPFNSQVKKQILKDTRNSEAPK